jgi:hypothetical protein
MLRMTVDIVHKANEAYSAKINQIMQCVQYILYNKVIKPASQRQIR